MVSALEYTILYAFSPTVYTLAQPSSHDYIIAERYSPKTEEAQRRLTTGAP